MQAIFPSSFLLTESPGVLQSAHVPSDGAMDRPIVLSGLSCTGNEANISECSSSLPSSGCTHQRDAGVRCGKLTLNCYTSL